MSRKSSMVLILAPVLMGCKQDVIVKTMNVQDDGNLANHRHRFAKHFNKLILDLPEVLNINRLNI